HQWIRRLPAERVAADLAPFLGGLGLPIPADLAWLARVVHTLKERAKTLKEMAEQASFYVKAPDTDDPQATRKFWTPGAKDRYALLIKRLEGHATMETESLELLYRGVAAEAETKLVELAQLTRIALTGKAASPPIFEVMSILGKAETLARVKAAKARVAA